MLLTTDSLGKLELRPEASACAGPLVCCQESAVNAKIVLELPGGKATALIKASHIILAV